METKEIVVNNPHTHDVLTYAWGGEHSYINEQELWGYLNLNYQTDHNYFEPFIPHSKLVEVMRKQPMHQSALMFKGNIYNAAFKPTRWLKTDDFYNFIQDYHIFNNAYLQAIRSKVGNIIGFKRLLAYYIRKDKKGKFYDISNGIKKEIKDIIHFKGYSASQNIYGECEYSSAVLSVNLNYESRLFRTRYYKNGSHAGFILSVTGDNAESAHNQIEKGLKEIKDSNQFKNILVSIPGGNEKSLQLLPLSDIAAKDEFYTIKNLSDEDVAMIHRVPLILLSIHPKTAGGFGKPSEAAQNYYITEMTPIINRLKSINERLEINLFDFNSLDYGD